tara:strand:+ start:239 stop:475 length:237 start_codon:yes stop_codon:yes gene_type:complete
MMSRFKYQDDSPNTMAASDRTWTWLSLGFATAAMFTSLLALATDPSFSNNAEVDYLDETPSEAVLDEMRGLGRTSADN